MIGKILKKDKVVYILLLLILILSAYLRLYRISQYLTFLGDEGRDVLVVKKMIVDHKFTLLGPTASVGGFFLGPIYYYFMLPFLWAWKLDPTGPAVMVALFGIATVYLIFLLGRNFFSVKTGLLLALLYALSPVIIGQSRSSWNPNLVPFFSALLMLFLWRIASRRAGKYDFLTVGIIIGIGIQLHYLFLFLVVSTGIWLIIAHFFFRKIRIMDLVLLVLGWIIGVSPFLLFELRHGFPNTRSIWLFLMAGKETGFNINIFTGKITEIYYRLFGRLIMRQPDKYVFQDLPDRIRTIWHWCTLLLAGVSLFFGLHDVITLIRTLKSRTSKKQPDIQEKLIGRGLVVLTLVVTLLLFGLYKKDVYDYYLGLIYAVPFLLTGSVIESVISSKILKWLMYLAVMSVAVLNWQGRPFIYPPNDQLGQTRNIAKKVLDIAGGKPFNFALITSFNSDHAYRYFLEVGGNPPVTIENDTVDPARHTVTNQLIVICEELNCQPVGHPLWEIAGFGQAEIVGKWEVPFVTIYKLNHYIEQNGQK